MIKIFLGCIDLAATREIAHCCQDNWDSRFEGRRRSDHAHLELGRRCQVSWSGNWLRLLVLLFVLPKLMLIWLKLNISLLLVIMDWMMDSLVSVSFVVDWLLVNHWSSINGILMHVELGVIVGHGVNHCDVAELAQDGLRGVRGEGMMDLVILTSRLESLHWTIVLRGMIMMITSRLRGLEVTRDFLAHWNVMGGSCGTLFVQGKVAGYE